MLLSNALMEKDSERESVLKLLADIYVCKRCTVRIFRGSFGDYSVDESENEVKKGAHCSTCLGILEGHTLYAVGKDVTDQMLGSKYDSSTFQIGISVPQCVIQRQASVITYLRDNGCDNIIREFPSVKNVAKMFITKLIERLTDKTMDAHSSLFVKLDYSYSSDSKEISKLDSFLRHTRRGKSQPSSGKIVDQPYRVEAIQKVVKSLSDAELKKHVVCPPQPIADASKFIVNMYHNSIFIGGRYNKYSRQLSQTPWFVNGIRRGETSTLELIGEKLKQFTQGANIRFQSAGREDADVRMLGKGRPFAVEITDPKITVITREDMADLQTKINSGTDLIAVHDLQVVTKGGLEIMKKGEEEKEKSYHAKLWCPEPISDESINTLNAMVDIELQQKTPIRVLHRRPIATRLRKVHQTEMKRADEVDRYELNVRTQAGTYIKEFVHGDFGRTEPSLRTLLGVPIDIVELDVMSIQMDWPPELEDGLEHNGDHQNGDKTVE